MKNGFLSIMTFFSFLTAVKASDSISIPSIYPSRLTAYDIEQGLPASCVGRIFIDPKGRLWLNSCPSNNIDYNLSFFQYDGKKYYPLKFNDGIKRDKKSKLKIKGITKKGIIYGYQLSLSTMFLFDPDAHEFKYIRINENEKISNIIEDEHDDLYVLSNTSSSYFIYKIEKQKLQLIRKIKIEKEVHFFQ